VFPRVTVARCEGLLKGSVRVSIVDVSRTGVQLESTASLRPGTAGELTAALADLRFAAQVKITRCRANGTVPDGKGGRLLLFSAGAVILRMDPFYESAFSEWLQRFEPAGSGESLVSC